MALGGDRIETGVTSLYYNQSSRRWVGNLTDGKKQSISIFKGQRNASKNALATQNKTPPLPLPPPFLPVTRGLLLAEAQKAKHRAEANKKQGAISRGGSA